MVGLVTTVNAVAGRVAMHAVREQLLQLQAQAVGLPLWTVEIPSPCPNDVYEAAMLSVVNQAEAAGVQYMAFGDLFLSDIRAYREERLAGTGIKPLFPIWGRDTALLARRVVESGVRAVITCVDPSQIPAELAGREFDERLLAELPPECDPCGENGEFHTFVWDGPEFQRPLKIQVGETVERDSFVFTDVLPIESGEPSAPEAQTG